MQNLGTITAIVLVAMPIYTLWPAAYLAWQDCHDLALAIANIAAATHTSIYAFMAAYLAQRRDLRSTDSDSAPKSAADRVLLVLGAIMPLYTFAPAVFASYLVSDFWFDKFFLLALVISVAHVAFVAYAKYRISGND